MVADIEHKEIFRHVEPPVYVRGPEESVQVIGEQTVTITQSDGGPGAEDFIVTVATKESFFDPASGSSIRVTYPMLEAMMIAHGRRSLHRGTDEANRVLKRTPMEKLRDEERAEDH